MGVPRQSPGVSGKLAAHHTALVDDTGLTDRPHACNVVILQHDIIILTYTKLHK